MPLIKTLWNCFNEFLLTMEACICIKVQIVVFCVVFHKVLHDFRNVFFTEKPDDQFHDRRQLFDFLHDEYF